MVAAMNDDLHAHLPSELGAAYTVDPQLRGGGMCRVFVATDTALRRRVVVKVLAPDLAIGINVDRFEREIQLAAQLQHPHIVPLLVAAKPSRRDDDPSHVPLLYYTMPYVEGE